MITMTNQVTSSLLQTFVGWYTDHRPHPYSLPLGMGFTLIGLVLLARPPVIRRCWWPRHVGIDPDLHPESSRIA
jgi:FSR family fosmidomycin resistance protein-like MFS transporter